MCKFFYENNILIITLVFLTSSFNAMAQEPQEANPNDFSSVDAIIKSLYEIIAGDAGNYFAEKCLKSKN